MIRDLGIVLAAIVILSWTSFVETTYTMSAQVTEIKDTRVEAVDKVGKRWEFYADEIEINDKINLIFDDNHTHNREDDIVKGYYKITE